MKPPSRWLILATVVSGTFISALNSSIVNVSVPTLMKTFNAKLHQVEWVITAFMIAFSVSMPLTNWLKERLSYRLLFALCLAVFSFGSLLCGLSNSLEFLIFSRIIQAIGGGLLGPLSMAIVTDTFPPNERGRAFGIWGFGVVIGPAIGPALGGYLSETLSWRWIFLINIPLGLASIAMGWIYLHRKKLEVTHYQKFDFAGFVWITAAIVALLYSLTEMASAGFEAKSLSLFVLACVFSYLFVKTEKKAHSPLLEISLYKNKAFVSCILITLARSISLFGGVFLLPLILQDHLHMTETQSGLVMLPGALVLALMMPLTGVWADKGRTYALTVSGLIVLAISFIVFIWINNTTPVWVVVFVQILRGVGLGLLVTPISTLTMSSVKHHQIAMASSISNLAQQLGGSFGIAILVLLKTTFFNMALGNAQSKQSADMFSLHACFVVAGIIVLLALWPTVNLRRSARGV